MFSGTDEDIKQTKVTQPAIFLHSVILFRLRARKPAGYGSGHSLGDFSAGSLGALSFETDSLVSKRPWHAKACEATPSSMAAVLAWKMPG
jgi:[acyl-carrier-protein] S-malonyltransferase